MLIHCLSQYLSSTTNTGHDKIMEKVSIEFFEKNYIIQDYNGSLRTSTLNRMQISYG